MSIRKLNLILFVTLLALLAAMFAALIGMVWVQSQITLAEERSFDSARLARQLRQSSDDLTKMARLFVVSGDKRYHDMFHEIVDIRDGNQPRPHRYDLVYWDLIGADQKRPRQADDSISIKSLMIAEGFTVEEFNKLDHAKTLSDGLVSLEETAMNAVEGKFRDDTGEFTRTGDPDLELAQNLMFGTRYMDEKAKIMVPINEFLTMQEERTRSAVGKLRGRISLLGILALGLCIATVVVAATMLLVQRKRILAPLSQVQASAKSVKDGYYNSPIAYRSNDEMGSLVSVFNEMLYNTKHYIESLEDANDALHYEKNRSENLLLNILPKKIVTRLQSGETEIADMISSITVLFADLVGFTKLTERLGAKEIVSVLSDIFAIFDSQLEKYGVEKIKTIGDSYMVATGITLDSSIDHEQRTAEFALAIRESFETWSNQNELGLQLRIGMHSGTAVAGIVGKQRFGYDIWGDVVNVASRMESTGQPGEIHVSDSIYYRLRDQFILEDQGETVIKGKRPMPSWYLTGHRYPDQVTTETIQ